MRNFHSFICVCVFIITGGREADAFCCVSFNNEIFNVMSSALNERRIYSGGSQKYFYFGGGKKERNTQKCGFYKF
jgi:hypothetical protein